MHALWNNAHGLAQGLLAEISQQRVVKTNLTVLWIPGARQQLQQRRLTAAGTAEDRNPLSCINGKVDTFQRVLRLFVIGEGHVIKRQRHLLRHGGLPGTERDFRLLFGNLGDAQGRGDHLSKMLESARHRGQCLKCGQRAENKEGNKRAWLGITANPAGCQPQHGDHRHAAD